MKRVKIADLRDHLSEHLRDVERGAEVIVTDRDRPIARIVPLTQGSGIRVISPTKDFLTIRDRRRSAAGWKIDSTTLLLEERQER